MKKSIGAKTIVYPTPVFIIGTYDIDGKPNAMNAAWGGISCSAPPCVSISLREATYSHGNIVHKEAFTVNIPSEKYIKEADYFGMASGRNEDKFDATGLTPVKSELVDAPYIREFPLILECKLVNTTELGLHTHFTGEILDVKVDENLMDNGNPDIEQIKPFLYDPSFRAYYGIGKPLGSAFSVGRDLMK
ncbi:flavin reductase family protein [Methanobacterium oryzae]|uniref:flavin reductase family protein n=1 Tax=Methanobacterium oryzae TaxID=69540 RepID=UPI003D20628F